MYSESDHVHTYKQRPITAFNKTGSQRPLSATHQPSRKINSSKPLTNKMNEEFSNEDLKGTTGNQDDLFEDPNFEEN